MTTPFDKEDNEEAVKSFKNEKSAGIDYLYAELLKYGPLGTYEEIAKILNETAETGQYPKEVRDGVLVQLQKPGHFEMGEFKVHQVRFFDFMPNAIHCLAYEEKSKKLAVSRANGSIEIWSARDDWFQEQVLPPGEGGSVEALVWCQGVLYAAGLHGNIYQYDLMLGSPKSVASANSGAIWCLTRNAEETHIAAGTENGCVVMFKVTEEGIVYEGAFDKQEGRILSIAWHSELNMIVTGGIDNIRVWSVKSRHAVQRLTIGRIAQNRETIVWTVAVTEDFTIISGDSRGKTSFWNGKQGTLIKSIQSHKADVLSVAVNQEGTSVVASGIDPTLVQFEFISSQPSSDWKSWVKSGARNHHSHDVRSVVYAGDQVVTGGVDCNLVVTVMSFQKKSMSKKLWRVIPAIDHKSLVSCARGQNMILLQYPTYVELWRLGSTNKSSDKPNDYLPLKTNQVKLLQLNAKNGEYVVCSAMSENGEWLAYSDVNSIRIFNVVVEDTESGAPKVQINRIRNIPDDVQPSQSLTFTPDGSTLLNATCGESVQVLKLEDSNVSLFHDLSLANDAGIGCICVKNTGEHFAVSDRNGGVHIFSLSKKKLIKKLPKYPHQACALAFSNVGPELAVAYTNQTIVEYNYAEGEYTDWSRNAVWHPQWMKRHSKLRKLMYHPSKPHVLMGHDEQMLLLINKTEKLPGADVKLYSKGSQEEKKAQQSNQGIHFSFKYKYILHFDILQDENLVIIERPPLAIMENLPPTLHRKKFGM